MSAGLRKLADTIGLVGDRDFGIASELGSDLCSIVARRVEKHDGLSAQIVLYALASFVAETFLALDANDAALEQWAAITLDELRARRAKKQADVTAAPKATH